MIFSILVVLPNRTLGLSGLIKGNIHSNLIVKNVIATREAPSPQVVALYLQQGKTADDAWRENSKGMDFQKRDLRGADLSGARLYNADLRGAKLDFAVLESANLQGADLSPAKNSDGSDTPTELIAAKLFDADLRYTNLFKADLRGADVSATKMGGAGLFLANLDGVKETAVERLGPFLGSVDLRGADMLGAQLKAADLRGADLQGADLRSTQLQGAILTGATLKGALLANANLRGARLISTNLDLVNAELVELGAFSQADQDTILAEFELLDIQPPAVPAMGSPTEFDSSMRLQIQGALYGDAFAKFTAIPAMSSEQRAVYGSALVSFIVNLACQSRPVVTRLILRIGAFTFRKDPFGSDLARAVQQREAAHKCEVLRDIREDYREVLQRAATAQW